MDVIFDLAAAWIAQQLLKVMLHILFSSHFCDVWWNQHRIFAESSSAVDSGDHV